MAMVESRLRTGGGGQDMGEEAILSLSFTDQLGLWQPGKEREENGCVFLDSIISLSVFYFIDFLLTLFLSFAFSRADLTSI